MWKGIGKFAAAIAFVLSIAQWPEQFRTWFGWAKALSGLSPFLSENLGRWILALVSLVLLLWSWDVHKKLYQRIQSYVRRQGMRFDYAYGLALQSLDVARDEEHPEGPKLQVGLVLRNVADGPLRYEVDSFDVVIGNYTVAKPVFPNRGSVIPKGLTGQFRYPPIDRSRIEGTRPISAVRFTIRYGHPEIGFARKATKSLTVHYRLDDQTGASYGIDSESDEPV